MIILVPAYEPDGALPRLITALRSAEPLLQILVVDDGSGPGYSAVFDDSRHAGATVIGYPGNKGKGQALKTGFGYVARHHPGHGVVCADGDGQHSVPDILRVAARVADPPDGTHLHPHAVVLGERSFDGAVPVRSRFGNAVTRTLFRLVAGLDVQDTQTGLRGYPASMLPWLMSVRGDQYEYELNLLLQAEQAGHRLERVRISTIYLPGNTSSHFRPIIDSLRIYAPLVRFSLSSLAAFGIDVVAFVALGLLTDSLVLAVVGARIISSSINFLVNRHLVFSGPRRRPPTTAALRYFMLAAVLLTANYALITLLSGIGLPELAAKVLTEALLFLMSFTAQRRFTSDPGPAPATPGGQPARSLIRSWAPTQSRHSNSRNRRKRTPTHILENIT